MKLTKMEGLNALTFMQIPTPKFYQNEFLSETAFEEKEFWSIRLSPRRGIYYGNYSDYFSVGLKSLHKCTDYTKLKEFYDEHIKQYDIIIHPTVRPDIIGTVIKYEKDSVGIFCIETFESFNTRQRGIPKTSESYDICGTRMFFSSVSYNTRERIKENKRGEIISYINKIDASNYNLEFIYQEEELVFTDFSVI